MPLLSAGQAASLTNSGEVRRALRDPRLQSTLRHIDGAGTREAALKRLETALEDPQFESFSLTALREIGWVSASAKAEAAAQAEGGAGS